ncbi:hypothetical protein [Rhizobium sp. Root708]|uniref:hypothetical protein n=1 Tax=Rhizobium sp. Root708 TaxID=1736592 RepID=UPI0009E6FD94|nr:hypothetical protein [Rhizobium sp. Root708]
MTDSNTWAVQDGMSHQHLNDDHASGAGEHDYADHVSAQRLSLGERFFVVGVLVMLGIAGMTAHFSSTPANLDPQTVGSISESLPSLDYCREHSPYPDRSC